MKTLDGHVRIVSGMPIPGGNGRPKSVIEVALETTELREATRELADRSESCRNLFDDPRGPVYITTRDGRSVSVNQAMLDLPGCMRDDLMGLTAGEPYANQDDRVRLQAAIERDGSVADHGASV